MNYLHQTIEAQGKLITQLRAENEQLRLEIEQLKYATDELVDHINGDL